MEKKEQKSRRPLPVDVPHAKLVAQIAESSGYNKYEIEDILLHLTVALQTNLGEGKTTAIRNLGKFTVLNKLMKSRWSGLLKRQLPEREEKSVKFAPSVETKAIVKGKTAVEEDSEYEGEDE